MEKVNPKYLDKSKKLWQKAEEMIAKYFEGKRVKASGALPGNKGDVKTDKYLIEVKSTGGNVIMVDVKWLLKINAEARGSNRIPLLVLKFGKGVEPLNIWVCINIKDWEQLDATFIK